MGKPGLLDIMRAWSEKTCHKPGQYTEENRARGQCAPTALAVQDLLGGEIATCKVGRERHYFNMVPPDKHPMGYVDLTAQQYGKDIFNCYLVDCHTIKRKQLMRHPDVRSRYIILATDAGMEPRLEV